MIESVNNERIKRIAKLNDKKFQDIENKFIVEGKHLVEEAIKLGYLEEIFLIKDEDIDFDNKTFVNENVMRKLSTLKSIPNIIGVAKKINNGEVKGNILMLDGIKDPGNMGTIIRSCVAFDIDTLVISKDSISMYNPKVVRASEGMIFNQNIVIDDLDKVLTSLKDYTIYTTDVNGGEDLKDIKFSKNNAIIIGSEASGVKETIKKYADKKLYIKMNSLCESLNAGVSASIIMYELNNKK